jgi:hypothetical protein
MWSMIHDLAVNVHFPEHLSDGHEIGKGLEAEIVNVHISATGATGADRRPAGLDRQEGD